MHTNSLWTANFFYGQSAISRIWNLEGGIQPLKPAIGSWTPINSEVLYSTFKTGKNICAGDGAIVRNYHSREVALTVEYRELHDEMRFPVFFASYHFLSLRGSDMKWKALHGN